MDDLNAKAADNAMTTKVSILSIRPFFANCSYLEILTILVSVAVIAPLAILVPLAVIASSDVF